MLDYRATPTPPADDTLEHYGVKGMRWGVRRAKKQLSKASSKEAHDKAISTLNKHRQKGEAKIKKLSGKAAALEKQRDKQIVKDDVKAAELHQKALKTRDKMGKRRVSTEKAIKLQIKADALDARAERIRANSELTKRQIEQNHTMQKAFKEQISLIDETIAEEGKRYLKAS